MRERKQRDSGVGKKQLAKPFDVTKFGSSDDPCFGKLWDPKNEICQSCGDIEVCGIAFSQNTRKREASIESNQEFLDLADAKQLELRIKKFIQKRAQKRIAISKTKLMVMRRFKLDETKTKQLIQKYYGH